MWCGTIDQQEDRERFFRLNQLIQVISKLKAKCGFKIDTDLFFLIIDICNRDGDFRMTKRVYEKMRQYNTPANSAIFQLYFQQQRRELKARKKEKLSTLNRQREQSKLNKEK